MRGTCLAAAEAAVAHGGAGYLNTDWGDLGHLQYLPVSEPGFAYGAAVSWCADANRDLDLAAALSVHAYDDPTGELAAALLELGDAYLGVVPQFPNISVLVMHLYFPQLQLDRGLSKGMTAADLAGVEQGLQRAVERLDRARPARADGDLVLDELRNAAALVALLCRDGQARLGGDGWLSSIPDDTRRALASDLAAVSERHRDLWLARNRPGGLPDSLAWLDHLHESYETGHAPKGWAGL